MPRLRDRSCGYRRGAWPDASLELLIGPHRLTVEQLAAVWDVERGRIMSWQRQNDPTRPWAFWQFDLGEEMPRDRDAETVRLAELGELSPEELAALRERANEASLRVDTDREHISGGNRDNGMRVDVQCVELWAAVRAAHADRRAGG